MQSIKTIAATLCLALSILSSGSSMGFAQSAFSLGGGQPLAINGVMIPRDLVFRFLPVTFPLMKLRMTSPYGMRRNPFGGFDMEMHPGVDFGTPTGTPVYATAAGVVTHVGASGAYGEMVEVRHGLGFTTRVGHLSAYAVKEGDTVDRNSLLGYSGSSGRATGPHVYFEIAMNGVRLDPVEFAINAYALYRRLD